MKRIFQWAKAVEVNLLAEIMSVSCKMSYDPPSSTNSANCPFDIKKTFYSPENGDCSLETYYLEMMNAHHKLAMLQPLSSDIKVMEKIRNQMNGNMFLIWIAS